VVEHRALAETPAGFAGPDYTSTIEAIPEFLPTRHALVCMRCHVAKRPAN